MKTAASTSKSATGMSCRSEVVLTVAGTPGKILSRICIAVFTCLAAMALIGGVDATAEPIADPPSATAVDTLPPPKPDDSEASNQLCLEAKRLTANGDPQGAITVVKDSKACPDALKAAENNMAAARQLLRRAEALLPKDASPSATSRASARVEIQDLIDSARTLDKHAAVPTELKNYQDGLAQGLSVTTSAWKQFTNKLVEPFWSIVSRGVLILVSALVMARLLVQLPRVDANPTGPFTARLSFVSALICGLLLVFSPLLFTVNLPPVWNVVIIAVLVIATALLTARAAAMRKRIMVTQAGKPLPESDASPTDPMTPLPTAIASHLESMGTSPRAGIELPVGVDTNALDKALIFGTSTGPVAMAQKALVNLLGVVPWRVIVSTDTPVRPAAPADGTGPVTAQNDHPTAPTATDQKPVQPTDVTPTPGYTIAINRNGRRIHTYSLTATALSAGDATIPPEKMIAAAALATLAEYYVGDFDELVGATRWQSIGWTYAAQDRNLPAAAKLDLLRRAAAHDLGNLQAEAALYSAMYRHSDKPEVLLAYAEWLGWAAETARRRTRTATQPVMYYRLLYTAAAVSVNAAEITRRRALTADPQTPVLNELRTRSTDNAQAWTKCLYEATASVRAGYIAQVDSKRATLPAHPDLGVLTHISLLSPGLRKIAIENSGDYRIDEATECEACRATRETDEACQAEALRISDVARYNEACRLIVHNVPGDTGQIMRLLDSRLLQPKAIEDFAKDPFLTDWVRTHRRELKRRRKLLSRGAP